MAVFKCKMCGGDLHPETGSSTCECEFCGTVQTVPTDDGEKKTNLFNRANRLRMNAEFDKAAAVYESIAAEFPEEAEAYWGLCLCAYGIEYVDDPATGEKKPTCHRTLPTSIMEDSNFEQACDNADAVARRVYREEAKAIDRIQKDILSIVANETPYDVFICYKETADEGGRTEDSVLAQEIYDALTGKGLKVFFSRITLEDKLGQQYEPYIYAALSSAKIMLAIGTKYEYYDAVWVKNEWMRFLSMMKTEKGKTLIPCYKGIDAYDMPKEFKNLQGQDMGKLGWLQDLTRGIDKLLGKDTSKLNVQSNPNDRQLDAFVKRARLFDESEEWEKALEYCEKALDVDPECSQAYLAKELAERKCKSLTDLATFLYLHESAEDDNSLKCARRFADSTTQSQLSELEDKVKETPERIKLSFDEKRAKEKDVPNWEQKKKRLEYTRKCAEMLMPRIEPSISQTYALNTDGRLSCTKCTDDQYGTYDNGRSACANWPSRFQAFSVEQHFVFGCEVNGKIRKTQGKINEPSNRDVFSKNWGMVSEWENVKVIVEDLASFGLKYAITEEGTVKVAGKLANYMTYHGEDKVEHLTDISSFGTYQITLGRVLFITNAGTIKSTEYIGDDKYAEVWKELSGWTNIKQIVDLTYRVAGLRSDGTLVFSSCFVKGIKDPTGGGIKEAEQWSGIVQFASLNRLIGLTETGKIVFSDYNLDTEENPKVKAAFDEISKWNNIAYLYMPSYARFIGITIDGKILKTEYFGDEKYNWTEKAYELSSLWGPVAVIKEGYKYIVGIKRDGSMFAKGEDFHGNTNVSNIQVFKNFDTIPEEISKGIASAKAEREKEIERQKEEQRRQEEIRKQERAKQIELERQRKESLQNEKDSLLNELANLKGLFSGKRKREIQERLDMIEHELNG